MNKQTDVIDYSALTEMDNVWREVLAKPPYGLGYVLLGIVILLTAVLLITGQGQGGFTPFILYVVVVSWRVQQLKNTIWERFARSNNWTITDTIDQSVVIPPSLQFGHSRSYSPVVQAVVDEFEFYLSAYNCTTGEGKYSQTHYFTVALVPMTTQLPHLILRNKTESSDLRQDLEGAEDLQLEGDFNRYFQLQVEKGREVDALTVITPDIMQTLLQNNRNEDIETTGNCLYLIMRGDERDYLDMQYLIGSVLALTQALNQNLALAGRTTFSATKSSPSSDAAV